MSDRQHPDLSCFSLGSPLSNQAIPNGIKQAISSTTIWLNAHIWWDAGMSPLGEGVRAAPFSLSLRNWATLLGFTISQALVVVATVNDHLLSRRRSCRVPFALWFASCLFEVLLPLKRQSFSMKSLTSTINPSSLNGSRSEVHNPVVNLAVSNGRESLGRLLPPGHSLVNADVFETPVLQKLAKVIAGPIPW